MAATRWIGRRALCLGVALSLAACASSRSSPAPSASEVFDDFLGAAGSRPSSAIWDYDTGHDYDDGLEVYTSSPDNIRLDGQGHLVVEALRTQTGYTSGRLVTRGKLNMQYGKMSARIKLPSGQGIWPAFWMLGANKHEVGWPWCGEIDLMELKGSGSQYFVSLHGPQDNSDAFARTHVVGTTGQIADLSDDFHTYWMNWQRDSIVIGVDESTLATFTPASLPQDAHWVFNHPMYVLLDVAVGGPVPGPPDASTPFPATMLVDWFRYAPGE